MLPRSDNLTTFDANFSSDKLMANFLITNKDNIPWYSLKVLQMLCFQRPQASSQTVITILQFEQFLQNNIFSSQYTFFNSGLHCTILFDNYYCWIKHQTLVITPPLQYLRLKKILWTPKINLTILRIEEVIRYLRKEYVHCINLSKASGTFLTLK